jgi:hypothetical protein
MCVPFLFHKGLGLGCELSNQVICGFMHKFVDMVQGSLCRGLIKGTNIETENPYIKRKNCSANSNYEEIREVPHLIVFQTQLFYECVNRRYYRV